MVLGVLMPLPIIWTFVRVGRPQGVVLIGLVFLFLLIFAGDLPAKVFFAEYGVLAWVLAEGIRQSQPMDRCVFFSALGSTAVSVLLLFVFLAEQDVGVSEFIEKQVSAQVQITVDAMKSAQDGSTEDLLLLEKNFSTVAKLFSEIYPSLLFVGSLITALINYFALQFFAGKLEVLFPFYRENFSEWSLPESMVWFLLVSGAAVALGGGLGSVGTNMLVVVLFAYFIQGVAVVVHFLETRKFARLIWFVTFFLIMLQPILIGITIGIGVFDLWADFRKLRSIPSQSK
jgi:uncharacterized protein YybS (DUF2232 family)